MSISLLSSLFSFLSSLEVVLTGLASIFGKTCLRNLMSNADLVSSLIVLPTVFSTSYGRIKSFCNILGVTWVDEF